MVSIFELLDDLRATALDMRDKGDRFERLIKAYLTTEPEWTARFENVWLWSEWPGRGTSIDTGIDLVAEWRDGEGLTAIQCKFYDPDHKIAKSDIDKFISASARSMWTERYIFDTAAGWTGNAEETLEGVAQRIDIGFLDDARVDWSKYSWSRPDQVELAKAHRPHPHQKSAIDDVLTGLAKHDRGKLIMACGTGKTFTSLRIAEGLVGEGGTVLFLVPSIQLLSQSLREWMAHSEVDIRPFAVCSDVRVGRQLDNDSGDISTIDLTEPATTNPQKIVDRMKAGRRAKSRMTVVFSTYQSIDVISQAQKLGLGAFDLVICDEAHRTTGVTLAGQDESHFVKVHDNRFIQASKRLYMTATPRVFDDAVTKKAIEKNAVLADMGDESTYGPELHRLGFGEAVEKDLLTDYKVVVLTIDEKYVAEHFQTTMAQDGEIQLNDAAKLLGCWQGLAKNYGSAAGSQINSPEPAMRRAVAFAKDIRSSKTASRAFPALVERALQDESRSIANQLRIESVHVDGTMGIHERNRHLDWLKAEPLGNTCRVLTNARCLSEGVDVPALDAVMFLTPRGSQVDVVQSVGRVMRKDPSGVKKQGYIILPVVVPSDMTPSEALNDNKRYQVVWQVLQALRSHDDRFHALVNQIDLNKKKNTKIDIVDVTPPPADDHSYTDQEQPRHEQLALDFGFESFRDAMYARIVKKVGERTYWEDWASDVADIAQRHMTRIAGLLHESPHASARFDAFISGLRGNLNDSITEDQAIEMLAQHLITRPVFEALFAGYDFAANNPVAQTMENMLAVLDEHALESENSALDSFYDSVRRRVAGVDNAEGRQRILVELYNNFFAKAFKKTVDKLGIVYTPIEIVDFILRSADDVLRKEFGQSLSDEGVHILDGFTGTGTFVVRLLQLDLIKPHDLARKYAEEIHANEILLLAYYIAAINIETTYADVAPAPAPFPGLVLTDTFQSYEDGDRQDLDVFPENNERITRQRGLPITVIVGNPPYSHKQGSGNDDNANESYPSLDAEIRRTYAEHSTAKNKNALYDSYIRALKWASLRLTGRGIIAFVTGNGWLDSNTADGMRLSLADEFSAIYVFNLRGDQNASDWRSEGGKVFGEGSKSGIAITVLVKNDGVPGPTRISYEQVGDGLTREQKLEHVTRTRSILSMEGRLIQPNQHGDWISHRTAEFGSYLPIYNDKGAAIFGTLVNGVGTSRDSWVYSSSTEALRRAMKLACSTYSEALRGTVSKDPKKIKWSSSLESTFKRRTLLKFDDSSPLVAMYRPFEKQRLYPDLAWLHRPRTVREFFPNTDVPNLSIYITPAATSKPFTALMTAVIPDLNLYGSEGGQALMRYRYESVDSVEATLDVITTDDKADVIAGYRRIDNITDNMLEQFRAMYPGEQITKDDIFYYVYGLLHSPDYREMYATDLKKSLPMIPFVGDFRGYADAGYKLSALHLSYETAEPYMLEGLDSQPSAGTDPYAFFSVGDKRMKFGKPDTAQKAAGKTKDRTTIHYNDRITVSGIPEEAYRYTLGSRSAIEWIIDRYYVKTDKSSGIVNDPNDWSREVGDPRYILDLLARIVTVSVETVKIVEGLPKLDIIGRARD